MVNIMLAQVLGLIAWLLLVYSYWREDIDRLLYYQVLSCIFYALHYYLLGAVSGLVVVVFELVRDMSYYKTDKDKYLFLGSIPIYILLGIFTYDGVLSLFSPIASAIDGFFLTFKKKYAVLGSFFTYILWIIYDLYCGSYISVVTELIIVISNILVLIKEKDDLSYVGYRKCVKGKKLYIK